MRLWEEVCCSTDFRVICAKKLLLSASKLSSSYKVPCMMYSSISWAFSAYNVRSLLSTVQLLFQSLTEMQPWGLSDAPTSACHVVGR